MSVYREELLLRSKDVDLFRRLRTSRLFELMQEASIRHTEQLGMGRDKTLDKGILWVVTLQKAEIVRMPEYDEQVVLSSWPGKTMHLFFPRYYRISDEQDRTLVSASALWTLVDAKTRRMAFPDRYGVEIEGVETGQEIALPSAIARMQTGSTTPFKVPFSYVDLNGHMNNTRYFDLAEDLIPAAAEGRALKSIATEYSSEARFGAELEISWGAEGSSFYLEGGVERPIFRIRMEYQ